MGERLGVLENEAPMFQKGPPLQAGAPAGSRAQRNLGGGTPERAFFLLKVYHICHCKVQPPNHRRGERKGRHLPQQTSSKCLHSIILEPRGSCQGTHTVNSG